MHGLIGWQSFWFYAGGALAALAVFMLVVTPPPRKIGRLDLDHVRALQDRSDQPAILSLRHDWRPAVHADDDRRHDLGVPFLHQVIVSRRRKRSRETRWFRWLGNRAPLLGYIADRIGLRNPVLIFGIALMLISGVGIACFSAFLPRYVGGLLFGVGSGAAMIPYAMIEEADPDNVKGSTTGAMNFLVLA